MNRFLSEIPTWAAFFAAATLTLLAGCTQNISIPASDLYRFSLEPTVVDVFTHEPPDLEKKAYGARYKKAVKDRRDRMAEIQNLKDDRVVGENRHGYLEIQPNLAGTGWETKTDHIKKTIDAENENRKFLILHEARHRTKTEQQISELIWLQWQRKSFPGEWIEVRDGTPAGYKWIQKPESSGAKRGDNNEN